MAAIRLLILKAVEKNVNIWMNINIDHFSKVQKMVENLYS